MKRLSEAELEVMNILWKNGALTSRKIYESLSNHSWSIKTVRTMINRLVEKELIGVTVGEENLYFPVLSEKEYLLYTKRRLADQLFDGSIFSLLMEFVDEGITKEEAEKLRKELEKYE